jgi:hypothetical protein
VHYAALPHWILIAFVELHTINANAASKVVFVVVV